VVLGRIQKVALVYAMIISVFHKRSWHSWVKINLNLSRRNLLRGISYLHVLECMWHSYLRSCFQHTSSARSKSSKHPQIALGKKSDIKLPIKIWGQWNL
jgi:hypothetical protein